MTVEDYNILLSDCPCCGGKAQFSSCADYVKIFCTGCGLQTPEVRSWPDEVRAKRAADIWNASRSINIRNAPFEAPTGLTVTELKRIVKDLPEANYNNELFTVWIQKERDQSSCVTSVWSLNQRSDGFDLLLVSE